MRFPLFFLLAALVGCAKTIIVPKASQQYAIASYDNCAQGPFTVNLSTPSGKDPTKLRLSFTEDATPAKLFYQVKAAGVAIASGSLEQKIEPKAGGFIPKNQCLGRVMPKMVTEGGGEGNAGGEGVEVVQPGYQAPQFQWVSFAKVPDGSPSVEIDLKDVQASTSIEVLYWSEVPYPLSKARMQVEIITLTKEKVPNKEREAKKLARAIEIALLRESERFEAAKEKDAYLAELQQNEPEQRDFYKVQRGKLLYKFSKQWSKSYYDDRYPEDVRRSLAVLAPQVSTFLSERQSLIYTYENWKVARRDERQQERQDRRKLAVERYTTIESFHLKRVMKRDATLEEKQKKLSIESEIKDIKLKRGKKLHRYDNHFERFNTFTDFRVFDRSRPEKYYKLQSKVSKFLSKDSNLRYEYERWKENKRQNKKDDREKARKDKELNKALKLAEAWRERFESLKEKDANRKNQLSGKSSEEQFEINAKRGLDIVKFRKDFEKRFYKIYYENDSSKVKEIWAKLQSEVNIFVSERQEQTAAYYTKKDLAQKDKYTKKDKVEKDKSVARQERGLRKTKREAKHFIKIKEQDQNFLKNEAAASGKEKEKIRYRWGKMLNKYSKHYYDKYDNINYSKRNDPPTDGSLAKLHTEVTALLSARYAVIQGYWTEKDKKKDRFKKDSTEREAAKHGTHRALRQWNRAVTRDKARLAQINKAQSEKKIKLIQTRQKRAGNAIDRLMKTYDEANYYGKQYLAKAYAEAQALRASLRDVLVEGPTPPPLPVYENPGQKPMDGAVWHPGYWKQEAGKWVWKKGYWELPPGAI